MSDDWRISATLASHARAAELWRLLERDDVEHDLETAAGERVIVSVDDSEMFLYAATREQAERASEAITRLAGDRGWELTTELLRWHPAAEEWLDPDVPLPSTDSALQQEHAELIGQERLEASNLGYCEFEVRVETASHRDTVELAHRLRSEGIPYLRRWRYLLIGATDEDRAAAIAQYISAEAPAGSTVAVEGSLPAANAERPQNPFAVFGGLGT